MDEHQKLHAYIEIRRIMREFKLTDAILDSIKQNNKYCKNRKCYNCDFWNECFYNMEKVTLKHE